MSLTADLHIRTRRFISAITDLFDDKRRSLERLP
jgi:HlyD family secretion protein